MSHVLILSSGPMTDLFGRRWFLVGGNLVGTLSNNKTMVFVLICVRKDLHCWSYHRGMRQILKPDHHRARRLWVWSSKLSGKCSRASNNTSHLVICLPTAAIDGRILSPRAPPQQVEAYRSGHRRHSRVCSGDHRACHGPLRIRMGYVGVELLGPRNSPRALVLGLAALILPSIPSVRSPSPIRIYRWSQLTVHRNGISYMSAFKSLDYVGESSPREISDSF